MRDLIIIGGGASGIVAAIAAARNKIRVILLEHNSMVGKKILSTGNGRCNLTNEYMDALCYRSDLPEKAAEIIQQFTSMDTIRFLGEIGLATKSKNGYIYPRSEQASSVRTLLEAELIRLGVEIHTDTHVISISCKNDRFTVHTSQGNFTSNRLILAAGSRASKGLGADGSGYNLAVSLGHTLSPIVPALVQLHSDQKWFKKASGVRADAKVTALINSTVQAADTGELQITDYGLSGIPIFQISRYITKALACKQEAQVEVNFLPNWTKGEGLEFFKQQRVFSPERTAESVMIGLFNKKLVPVLLNSAGIREKDKLIALPDSKLEKLITVCTNFLVPITRSNSYEQAQICAGGVRLSEIHSDTLASNVTKGLYLTGELLDVDGICGGYNLQWAFATGYLAGQSASK